MILLCIQLNRILPLILKGINIKFNVPLDLLAKLLLLQCISGVIGYLKNISLVFLLKPLANTNSNYFLFCS